MVPSPEFDSNERILPAERGSSVFGLGLQELIIILLILLLLFGGSRIPGLARSLGSSITEFRHGLEGRPDESEHPSEPANEPPSKSRMNE